MKKYLLSFTTSFMMILSAIQLPVYGENNLSDVIQPSVTLSDDGKTLLQYSADCEADTYTVPEGIEIIASSAFNNAVNLKTILLPDSLKRIEKNAFQNCRFETIIIPESVKIIGKNAFADNTELSEITIPEGVLRISTPFSGCTSLKEITIKRADKKVYENHFSSLEPSDDETRYSGLFGRNQPDSYCNVYVPDYVFPEYEGLFYSEHNLLVLPESMIGHTILDGDINGDNDVSVADAVMLQNFLLGKNKDILWYNANIISEYSSYYKTGEVDVFDLIELKKKLLTATM